MRRGASVGVDPGGAEEAGALWFLMGAVACSAVASEGIDRLTQLHFTQAFGTPSVWFGAISIGAMVAAIVLDAGHRWRGHARLAILQAGAAVSAFVLATSGWFWPAAVASVLLGMPRGTPPGRR